MLKMPSLSVSMGRLRLIRHSQDDGEHFLSSQNADRLVYCFIPFDKASK